MKPTLLLSQKILSEYGLRIHDILAAAPRPLQLLPFTPELARPQADIGLIEAACYSRDIWEGAEKNALRLEKRAPSGLRPLWIGLALVAIATLIYLA